MASGRLIDYLGVGPIADRPAAPDLHTETLGLWYASDTDTLSAWDGTAWEDIAGSGIPSVQSVGAGDGIDVDATDPSNPEIALDPASLASLLLADSAVQPGDLAAIATSGDILDATGFPGGSTDFLRADGTFATPGGGGTITVDGTPGIDELVLGTNLSGSAAGSVYTINATGGGGGSSVVVDQYFASGPVPSDTGVFENPSSSNRLARGRIARSSGKYCFAVNAVNYGNGANFSVGVMQVNCTDIQLGNTGSPSASKASSWGLIQSGGAFTGFNGGVSGSGPVPSAPDVIVVYVDFAVGIWWEINGVVMGGGDPAAGTSPTFSNISGPVLPGGSVVESGGTPGQIDFDLTSASPFGATIPAGYTMWGI